MRTFTQCVQPPDYLVQSKKSETTSLSLNIMPPLFILFTVKSLSPITGEFPMMNSFLQIVPL